MTKIAIIGAGLAGLTAAHDLKEHANVTLYEKSRGVGGRLATRRAEPFSFDHGAQFFKARSKAFVDFIDPMIQDGTVQRWDARFAEIEGSTLVNSKQWGEAPPHYVGAPSMNAVGKYLGADLDIRFETRITSMQWSHDQWHLQDERGETLAPCDWVLSTLPAQQAFDLLPPTLPFRAALASVQMRGCFSLMLGFGDALPIEFDAALVRERDISWISLNSSKPGRPEACSLLVHSTNLWADAHIEDDRDWVTDYLCDQTSEVIGYDVHSAQHKAVHGWRYANIGRQTGATHFLHADQRVGLCGDWLVQGRVEAAFKSGRALADSLKEII